MIHLKITRFFCFDIILIFSNNIIKLGINNKNNVYNKKFCIKFNTFHISQIVHPNFYVNMT